MTTELDTLATAPYVRTGDLLKESPHLAPERPGAGIFPQLSDAELITLAVMQPLLGFKSEARWVRYANAHLWTDDVWIVDSTPVECGRSRETAKRSDLAGWAEPHRPPRRGQQETGRSPQLLQ